MILIILKAAKYFNSKNMEMLKLKSKFWYASDVWQLASQLPLWWNVGFSVQQLSEWSSHKHINRAFGTLVAMGEMGFEMISFESHQQSARILLAGMPHPQLH